MCCKKKTDWRLLECRFEQAFVRFTERIHKIHFIEREPSKRIYVSGWDWRKCRRLPDRIMSGQKCGRDLGKAVQNRENQEWTTEKAEAWPWSKTERNPLQWSWKWPGRWGPQDMSSTGGGGVVRVPNLRVCEHRWIEGGTRRGEGRINVLPWYRLVGVVSTSRWVAQGGKIGLPARVSGHHVVRGRQSLPILEVRPGNRQGWWKRSIFRCWAGSSPWTRPSAPGCGDTLKA